MNEIVEQFLPPADSLCPAALTGALLKRLKVGRYCKESCFNNTSKNTLKFLHFTTSDGVVGGVAVVHLEEDVGGVANGAHCLQGLGVAAIADAGLMIKSMVSWTLSRDKKMIYTRRFFKIWTRKVRSKAKIFKM